MKKTALSFALLCATVLTANAAPTFVAPEFDGHQDAVFKDAPDADVPSLPMIIPNYGGDPIVIEDISAHGALAAAAVSGTTNFLAGIERRAVRQDGITVEGNAGTSEISGVELKGTSFTLTSQASRGDWAYGTALSVTNGEIDKPESAASDFNALQGAAFVRWSPNGIVNVVGTLAYGKYDQQSETTLPDVSTDVWAGSVMIGLASTYRVLSFEPYVGFRTMRIDDSAAENKADVHQIPVGIRIGTETTVNDWTFAGSLDASYTNQFGDDKIRIDLAETDAFIGTHAAKAVIGLSAQYKETFMVSVSYGYAAGDKDYEEHIGQVGASLLF